MVGTRSGTDHTRAMDAYSRRRVQELDSAGLCGYILKKNSPSCGMERVKVYGAEGRMPGRGGVGLFARALMERHPLLPVEEEGRLNDPVLRENFIDRVFAYRRWMDFLDGRYTAGRLVAFHTAEKLLLLSHSPKRYVELGRLVARAKDLGAAAVKLQYGTAFMEAVAERTTVRKHTNVLQHMAGYFKRELDAVSRAETRPGDRRLPDRSRAAHRPHHADPASREGGEGGVSAGAGVPRSASQGVDAPQSRVRAIVGRDGKGHRGVGYGTTSRCARRAAVMLLVLGIGGARRADAGDAVLEARMLPPALATDVVTLRALPAAAAALPAGIYLDRTEPNSSSQEQVLEFIAKNLGRRPHRPIDATGRSSRRRCPGGGSGFAGRLGRGVRVRSIAGG